MASEIRLVDLNHLVLLIHKGQMANINDLINSSTELYFRPGTLDFACGTYAELLWSQPPAVKIGFEFRNAGIQVFFQLRVAGVLAGVEIQSINAAELPDSETGVARLVAALADASLVR